MGHVCSCCDENTFTNWVRVCHLHFPWELVFFVALADAAVRVSGLVLQVLLNIIVARQRTTHIIVPSSQTLLASLLIPSASKNSGKTCFKVRVRSWFMADRFSVAPSKLLALTTKPYSASAHVICRLLTLIQRPDNDDMQ